MSLIWVCKCGNRPWLHHDTCSQCNAPKPVPEEPKPATKQEKPKHDDNWDFCD